MSMHLLTSDNAPITFSVFNASTAAADSVSQAANFASLPLIGKENQLYITEDSNKLYRWSGGTYVLVASLTKGDLGLGNVDNTSDANKSVSTAQALADTAVLNAAASDATAKANAAQAASTPIAHVGSSGTAHAAVSTTVAGFMSASDKVKLDGVSGTNTGDETLTSIKTKLGITVLSGDNTGDQDISGKENTSNKVTSISGASTDTQYPSAKLLYDQLALKALNLLTGFTSGAGVVVSTDTVLQAFQKIVGNIAALTTVSIADSLNKRYVTDAQLTLLGNTSGTNTGDQTTITGNAGSATILQTARTINGVSFDGSANISINAVDSTARVASSLIGAANGVAPLGSDSKISATYLPSYVDDVLEVANYAALPVTGETGKIYVDLATNKAYRWSGSAYVYITSGAVDSVAGKTGVVSLVKADVGLGNVDNTADASKPVSTATQTALNLKLDSSSYTAADVLSKLVTVDGSGSGLDADTLDGINSAAFLQPSNYSAYSAFSGTISNPAVSFSGVAPANSLVVASNGMLTTKLGWRDIVGSATVKGSGANDPSWSTFISGINAYSLSATTMKELWFTFHIDHDYAVGTTIYPHVHWATTGTNTGVVRWGFEYTIAKGHNQSAFPTSTTVYVEQAGSGTAYKHMVAEVAAGISSAELEPDSLILMRIFRDASHANDTQTSAAFMFTADIHYQCDRVATINKSPNFYV